MLTIPLRTVSGMNVREHFRVRAKRVKAERQAVALVLGPQKKPALPIVVTLTRIAPSNGLDPDDNLPSAFKAVRDEIAAGRLVTVLDEINAHENEVFHAVYVGQGGPLPTRVRALLDYLAEFGRVS